MIVLRACTELLRKLSRAEDTVFCGRVFIYLFQSFPLGDKSAVNLRGEFHVENTTVYDKSPAKAALSPESMDVDEVKPSEEAKSELGLRGGAVPEAAQTLEKSAPGSAIAAIDTKLDKDEEALDADTLYPIFWSLQDYFSKPTKLFEPANLEAFKNGLRATLAKFKQVQSDAETRGVIKHNEEVKQGTKRKWGEVEDEDSSSFNPKYLTSRDLFELEVVSTQHFVGGHENADIRTDQRPSLSKAHSRASSDTYGIPPFSDRQIQSQNPKPQEQIRHL